MTDNIANTHKHAEDWARDAAGTGVLARLTLYDGMAFADPYLFRDAIVEIERLRQALRSLRNEVLATLSLAELDMRQAAGHTNINCLIRRADEARAALDKVQQ